MDDHILVGVWWQYLANACICFQQAWPYSPVPTDLSRRRDARRIHRIRYQRHPWQGPSQSVENCAPHCGCPMGCRNGIQSLGIPRSAVRHVKSPNHGVSSRALSLIRDLNDGWVVRIPLSPIHSPAEPVLSRLQNHHNLFSLDHVSQILPRSPCSLPLNGNW